MIDFLSAMKAVTALTGALLELVKELRGHKKAVEAHTAELAAHRERSR